MLSITRRSKDQLISDVLLWTPTHGHTSFGLVEKTSVLQLDMDTGCRLKDLPRDMTDKVGW